MSLTSARFAGVDRLERCHDGEVAARLTPGLDLGTLADLVPDPAAVVRDLLNPNTIC